MFSLSRGRNTLGERSVTPYVVTCFLCFDGRPDRSDVTFEGYKKERYDRLHVTRYTLCVEGRSVTRSVRTTDLPLFLRVQGFPEE